MENLLSLDFAGITVGNGVFFIVLIFAFNGVYRMVKKVVKNRPIQLTYTLSLLFTLTTLALTTCYSDNSTAFYTFLVTGLIFWIIYFGYTPKWSPHFMLSFIMIFPALILVHSLLMNAAISAVELNTEKTAGIYFWEVPMEALYISFLVCYLSTLLYEWRRNKKST